MLASPAEIELGLSLAKINGSQIWYVSFTNINKTIHKVFNPTILWGGGQIPPPPPSLRVKSNKKKLERLEISEDPQSF